MHNKNVKKARFLQVVNLRGAFASSTWFAIWCSILCNDDCFARAKLFHVIPLSDQLKLERSLANRMAEQKIRFHTARN